MGTIALTARTTDEAGKNLPQNLSLTSHLILDEAFRRDISITIIEADKGLFSLQYGDKKITCCSSLTELTSSVSKEICTDKNLTNLILRKAKIRVPDQIIASNHKTNKLFFEKYKAVVTKPHDQSSGQGLSVDIRSVKEMDKAINHLKVSGDETVLIEEYVVGEDIRTVVIDYKFVAAIHRVPPFVTGNGKDTIRKLITNKNNSPETTNKIPLNYETKRCVLLEGYKLEDVLPHNKTIRVRKNTNEHTGGIPQDVTELISPKLRKISEDIARIINIPVIGIDFLVPDIEGDEYTIIEVNSRPGLDGHEPQPVAEKFIDFLFPESKK